MARQRKLKYYKRYVEGTILMLENRFHVHSRTISTALMMVFCLPILGVTAAHASNIRLTRGDVIAVKLDKTLSSRTSRVGETFATTVINSLGKGYGLPNGTIIYGKIVNAVRKNGNNPGQLSLRFWRIAFPNGRSYSIDGALIGLDNKSVLHESNGRLVATPSHENKRLTYLGYGAGAGLVLGVLTKHTLQDTLIGAGLGYLLGTTQKSHPQARDVVLHPGTQIGVRIDHGLSIASSYSNASYQGGANSDYHVAESRNGNRVQAAGYRNSGAAGNSGYGVMVNQQSINFQNSAQPINSGGVILVPARSVLQKLGSSYSMLNGDRGVRVSSSNAETWTISQNSRIAVSNSGQRVELEGDARIINGSLYLPARFFKLVTGKKVGYDPSSRTVLISTGNNNGNSNRK